MRVNPTTQIETAKQQKLKVSIKEVKSSSLIVNIGNTNIEVLTKNLNNELGTKQLPNFNVGEELKLSKEFILKNQISDILNSTLKASSILKTGNQPSTPLEKLIDQNLLFQNNLKSQKTLIQSLDQLFKTYTTVEKPTSEKQNSFLSTSISNDLQFKVLDSIKAIKIIENLINIKKNQSQDFSTLSSQSLNSLLIQGSNETSSTQNTNSVNTNQNLLNLINSFIPSKINTTELTQVKSNWLEEPIKLEFPTPKTQQAHSVFHSQSASNPTPSPIISKLQSTLIEEIKNPQSRILDSIQNTESVPKIQKENSFPLQNPTSTITHRGNQLELTPIQFKAILNGLSDNASTDLPYNSKQIKIISTKESPQPEFNHPSFKQANTKVNQNILLKIDIPISTFNKIDFSNSNLSNLESLALSSFSKQVSTPTLSNNQNQNPLTEKVAIDFKIPLKDAPTWLREIHSVPQTDNDTKQNKLPSYQVNNQASKEAPPPIQPNQNNKAPDLTFRTPVQISETLPSTNNPNINEPIKTPTLISFNIKPSDFPEEILQQTLSKDGERKPIATNSQNTSTSTNALPQTLSYLMQNNFNQENSVNLPELIQKITAITKTMDEIVELGIKPPIDTQILKEILPILDKSQPLLPNQSDINTLQKEWPTDKPLLNNKELKELVNQTFDKTPPAQPTEVKQLQQALDGHWLQQNSQLDDKGNDKPKHPPQHYYWNDGQKLREGEIEFHESTIQNDKGENQKVQGFSFNTQSKSLGPLEMRFEIIDFQANLKVYETKQLKHPYKEARSYLASELKSIGLSLKDLDIISPQAQDFKKSNNTAIDLKA